MFWDGVGVARMHMHTIDEHTVSRLVSAMSCVMDDDTLYNGECTAHAHHAHI
jgi:hypothetical protein